MVFRLHLQWEALVECRILIRLAAFVIKGDLLVVEEEMQCLTIRYCCLSWMQINSIEEMGTERMVLAVVLRSSGTSSCFALRPPVSWRLPAGGATCDFFL